MIRIEIYVNNIFIIFTNGNINFVAKFMKISDYTVAISHNNAGV